MEPSIWEASNRRIFPWSLSLKNVIQLALFIIVGTGVAPIGTKVLMFDTSFLWLLGMCCSISIVAYFMTDALID